MMRIHHFVSLALVLAPLSAQVLAAQGSAAQNPESAAEMQFPASLADLRVPVHTGAADAMGGEYGLWAMGPRFKASFHDGFEFVPLLGVGAPRNLPLHWRTQGVTCGGVELRGEDTSTVATDWRVELRSGAVVEAYDIRGEGVEQTFVLSALPSDRGAVVVRAVLDTPLVAADRGPQHAALVFHDADDQPVVEYGAGVVFDAAGRRAPVRTAYAAGEIQLIVDAEFVADATLPLTIDPLVRTVTVDSSSADFEFTDIVRDAETGQLFYTYSVAASASDFDQFGWLVGDGLAGSTRVFADITSGWSATHGRVAFAAGADRFALTMQRIFPNSLQSRIRVYLHDNSSLVQNSGRTLFLEPGAGLQDADPVVGGTVGFGLSDAVLVAFRRDQAQVRDNTDFSQVRAMVVDCRARSMGADFVIGGDMVSIDAEAPSVNRQRFDAAGDPWIVTWQEHANVTGDNWLVLGRQVFADGALTTHVALSRIVGDHAVRAKVDGESGRYFVAWVAQPNVRKTSSAFGIRIEGQRFDWQPNGIAARFGIRPIATHPTLQNLQLDASHPIAFDRDTLSHWMVGWAERDEGVFAARVGFDGDVAEAVTLRRRANETIDYPSVCYDDAAGRFVATYVSRDSLARIRIAAVERPAAAQANTGTPCPANARFDNLGVDLPLAGSQFSRLSVTGLLPLAPVFVVAGVVPAPTPLPLPLSPRGCALFFDPSIAFGALTVGTADNVGEFRFDLPLRSSLRGDFFVQAISVESGGLTASDMLQLTIR